MNTIRQSLFPSSTKLLRETILWMINFERQTFHTSRKINAVKIHSQKNLLQYQVIDLKRKKHIFHAIHNKHHYVFNFERLAAASFLIMGPITVYSPSVLIDVTMSVLIVQHHHVGISAILQDYCRPDIIGVVFSKFLQYLHWLLSGILLYGTFSFLNKSSYSSLFKQIWNLNAKEINEKITKELIDDESEEGKTTGKVDFEEKVSENSTDENGAGENGTGANSSEDKDNNSEE